MEASNFAGAGARKGRVILRKARGSVLTIRVALKICWRNE